MQQKLSYPEPHREWQGTDSSFFKKGLICHFSPEVVKSRDVGGFQNRLSTLVGFTVSSESVWDAALWCGVAGLGWWPSQGDNSLCVQFSPWAVAQLDTFKFFLLLFLHVQFFISTSRWFQWDHRRKQSRRTGAGAVTWFHLERLPEGEASDNWLVVGHISPVWWPQRSASEPVTSSVSFTGVKEMGVSKWWFLQLLAAISLTSSSSLSRGKESVFGSGRGLSTACSWEGLQTQAQVLPWGPGMPQAGACLDREGLGTSLPNQERMPHATGIHAFGMKASPWEADIES